MQRDDEKAWGAKLAARLAPVPPAGADLRKRIAAIAEQPVAEARPFSPRWAPAVSFGAAMAASLLLWVAAPFSGTVNGPEVSAEESYVVETFATVFEESGDWAEIEGW